MASAAPGQAPLFGELQAGSPVLAADPAGDDLDRARRLDTRWPARWFLGTSSWHFPGWAGQVWDLPYAPARLSRDGLPAYARHPLLRSVSVDRSFYRAPSVPEWQGLAAQVPESFRFVVKAPAMITDASAREGGHATQPNPAFLDAALACEAIARPLRLGLGEKLGVLVLQLSPLPARWLDDEPGLHARLEAVLAALRGELRHPALIAVEIRDAGLLTPALAALLKRHAARYCLGLHDRMPPIDEQLPLLRALWPGDLVCRWSLQRGQRYAQARDGWAPFDRLRAPDVPTRRTLAAVMRATLDAGHRAFVIINNKAEGSAPESVRELARVLSE